MLRQKDVIGEWVPKKFAEGGVSEVMHRRWKWVRGLRWEEVDRDLVLRHETSKKEKPIVVDLKLAPMVMEDLRRIGAVPARGRRCLLGDLRSPIIVNETTGRPFTSFEFRYKWRVCARAAGVPDHVYNMDSRAGAITEAFDAEVDPDFIRQTATHSELSQTQGYNRGDYLRKSSIVMRRRVTRRRTA